MSPIFYEDSLGAKLAEKAHAAMDNARDYAEQTTDADLIDDPEALAAAEAAARGVDPDDVYEQVTDEWVAVLGPSKLSGLVDNAGFAAKLVTTPLEAAGIPCAWDPYPPEEMPSYRYGYGAVDRPFTLLVPASRAAEAAELLGTQTGSASPFGLPIEHERSADSEKKRRSGLWLFFLVFIGFDLLVFAIVRILALFGVID
jgi:hypothetical protein